jgi:hypothetical protein
MAAADALVALAFILIAGLLCWLFAAPALRARTVVVEAAERRATQAEAALVEIATYAEDHYVEPEVAVIRDILAKHGFAGKRPPGDPHG